MIFLIGPSLWLVVSNDFLDMQQILNFLSDLAQNNDREWFSVNKSRYTECRLRFEEFSSDYLARLAQLDPDLSGLTPKDCIWRIYRDVRFSNDKRPFKEWFGVFPAAPAPGRAHSGGKKSMRGGYYLHLQPGYCLFAGGIWCPSSDLLKALRQEVLTNADEVMDIMQSPSWSRYFGDFDTDYMLKKLPVGFDLSLVEEHLRDRVTDWLKRKAFTFTTPLTDKEVTDPKFLDHLMDIAAAAKPMNDFLNYTFEEYGEFPEAR